MKPTTYPEVNSYSFYVFDSSAIINLIGSGFAKRILTKLSAPSLLEGFVYNEVTKERKRRVFVDGLVARKLLQAVDMDDNEASFFVSLISSSPKDSLHDGEAATLSIARYRKGIAVIDEKKALRIAREQNRPIPTCCTLDLLRLPSIIQDIKGPKLNKAVFNALKRARMRIPINHEEWVLGLLSAEQIAQCTSIRNQMREILGIAHPSNQERTAKLAK